MPTHGSLTKAGKVRNQTPKIASESTRKTMGPRRKNHRNYTKMLADTRFDNGRGRRRRRRR
jgi:small subunit ribosomal protein S30e